MGKIPAHLRPIFDTPLNRFKLMLKKRGILVSNQVVFVCLGTNKCLIVSVYIELIFLVSFWTLQASFLDSYDINKGGTRDEPLMVPMISESRIFGCQCHEDQEHLVYHRVLADELKQCTCGYFFKGMRITNPFTVYDMNYEIPDDIKKKQLDEKK